MFLFRHYIEEKTLSGIEEEPDVPNFDWELLPSDNGYAPLKIHWRPNLDGHPGSHFFTKYRYFDYIIIIFKFNFKCF